MGVGSGGPWIFVHCTDKVEKGLMVLFFGLVCPVCHLPPEKFFFRRLWALDVQCALTHEHVLNQNMLEMHLFF